MPVCNHQGLLINDPVLLRLAEDRFWLSIADSDIELWASGIAAERGMDVAITEPDVSPMAVQGPKAASLIAALFGDWIYEMRYFDFKQTSLNDIPLLLARSGWSKQGGFELYLQDRRRGNDLWNIVKQAGKEWDIGPGVPNDTERLESGLLSYGADARLQVNPVNPFEVGLDKWVDLESDDDFIGKQALKNIRLAGVKRQRTGFFIEGKPVTGNQHHLPVYHQQSQVGIMMEMAYSPRIEKNIAIGLIDKDYLHHQSLAIRLGDESRLLSHATLPFI